MVDVGAMWRVEMDIGSLLSVLCTLDQGGTGGCL
jgi:hypothetical protein